MKTVKNLVLLFIVALSVHSCKVSDLTSSKLVNKTANKVATKAIYGNYSWASDNLNVTTFRNGDPITEAKTDEEWVQAAQEGKPAWCYLNNDPANGKKYGILYNWFAVSDSRGLAPEGYRIPTNSDFEKLIESTGVSAANHRKKELVKGGKTGFNSKLGGYRGEDGYFHKDGKETRYWASNKNKTNPTRAHALYIGGKYDMSDAGDFRLASGFYVRCLKE
ncbi:MAG TPA: fibrobacter succinogenes major paralogous domain-containing protein [Tenuifilaceae bacterium]|nr:fibrobacter succinogenes major paralogous domain-containing protein [Tenuifilaceae bacterium]